MKSGDQLEAAGLGPAVAERLPFFQRCLALFQAIAARIGEVGFAGEGVRPKFAAWIARNSASANCAKSEKAIPIGTLMSPIGS